MIKKNWAQLTWKFDNTLQNYSWAIQYFSKRLDLSCFFFFFCRNVRRSLFFYFFGFRKIHFAQCCKQFLEKDSHFFPVLVNTLNHSGPFPNHGNNSGVRRERRLYENLSSTKGVKKKSTYYVDAKNGSMNYAGWGKASVTLTPISNQ